MKAIQELQNSLNIWKQSKTDCTTTTSKSSPRVTIHAQDLKAILVLQHTNNLVLQYIHYMWKQSNIPW